MSARENAYERGVRLLTSGRLVVERVDAREIRARCRGDHGEVWRLGFKPGQWFCECPARRDCAHLIALWSVTLRPGALP